MKKLIFSLGILPLFTFYGCYDFTNIETPESLSVTSNTTYELPAGKLSFEVKEQLGIEKLKEILEDNSSDDTKLSVYDYNPGNKEDSVFQYVINYPIKEIPISINADYDVGKNLSFNTDFEVPDFTQNISSALTVSPKEFPVPEGVNKSVAEAMNGENFVYFNITSPDFDTMTLRSGSKLKVDFTYISTVKGETSSSKSDDFSMPVSLSLVDRTDTSKVLAVSETVDVANGGTIYLDLTDKEIVPNMRLYIGGTLSGGVASKINKYKVAMKIENPDIAKITGLNMDKDDLGTNGKININQTFQITGMNDALDSATIQTGSVSFHCQLPEGWSGVSCDNSDPNESGSYFVLSGGINVPNDKFTDQTSEGYFLKKTANLSGIKIEPAAVKTDGSYIKIALQNATIVFPESGNARVTLVGECKIDELKELVLDLSSSEYTNFHDTIETGINLSTILSDLFKGDDSNLIQNVKFSNIDAYIFITTPPTKKDVLADFSINGTINATYDGLTTPLCLIDTATKPITIKESDKSIDNFADENSIISSSEPFEEHKDESQNFYSCKVNDGVMTDILNAYPDNLKISYSLGLTGGDGPDDNIVTLSNADLALLNSNSALKISIAMVIPLEITLDDVTDGNDDDTITIDDALALVGSKIEKDLLNRDSKSDSEKWLDYTPAIESISIIYTLQNTMPLDQLSITFNDTGSQITKELDTSSGEYTIDFTQEEIESVCKNYPFIPTVKLEIGGADGSTPKSFKRNSEFVFNAKFRVKTNGTVKIWDSND